MEKEPKKKRIPKKDRPQLGTYEEWQAHRLFQYWHVLERTKQVWKVKRECEQRGEEPFIKGTKMRDDGKTETIWYKIDENMLNILSHTSYNLRTDLVRMKMVAEADEVFDMVFGDEGKRPNS